mmetsp:Transcript_5046/g.20241  ORF Transcript_5046/g.20241 Transcript_5046/m.20241 type:complete len:255 (+) Transcript_5046:1300-2064(+)
MLSAPSNPANGCVFENSASSTLPVPFATSTFPTNRNTMPRSAASSACFLITPSNSGRRSTYSFVSQSSSAAGTSDATETSSRLMFIPLSRAAITTFRATSRPLRSSRGSGSVYPASFAASTTVEKGVVFGSQVLNRNDIVPLKMPCTTRTSSPLARSVRSVDTMGKPAPMVPSYSHFAFPSFAAFLIFSKRFKSPELAFLLGVTTLIPRCSHPLYREATSSDAEQSMITALGEPASRTCCVNASMSAATDPEPE